jgi:quaternary ammonium compound-resistance protein SugE
MAWTLLLLAALLEVGWAVGLKYTHGFTRLWPSVWTGLAMVLSMALLARSARTLPIGTAYAVWTGIGAAGTAVLGVYLFGEAASVSRLAGVGLIVLGVALLKTAG